ncbi:MAG: ATP-binding protein, partial [Promethearchaeota archaeon]
SLEPNIHKLKHLFNDYYTLGSIPEYINNPKKERLEEYFENIILKDIVERYNIRNTKLIKDLGIYLLSNATNLISHGSLSKVFDVSINTIKEYISFLESAYLFFRLNKFSYSYKKQFKTSSKIYSIDNGLINLVSFKFSENKGRLFENLVFLELKRNNKEIYYHKIKKECDFIIKKNLKITNAIQVSISLDLLKNKKREYEGLIEALNEYNLKEGLIITEDQYEDLKINGFKIKIRPLWFWLLNKTE